MELARLLLKLLYLGLLYVCLLLIVKPTIEIRGPKLIVSVLSLSVLLTHFTFDTAYDFVTKNEIVIQEDTKNEIVIQEDTKDEKDVKSRNSVEIVENTHKETSSNSLFDRNHKFVQDKVFY